MVPVIDADIRLAKSCDRQREYAHYSLEQTHETPPAEILKTPVSQNAEAPS